MFKVITECHTRKFGYTFTKPADPGVRIRGYQASVAENTWWGTIWVIEF